MVQLDELGMRQQVRTPKVQLRLLARVKEGLKLKKVLCEAISIL